MLRSIAMTVMMLGISPAAVSFAEDAVAEGPIRAVVLTLGQPVAPAEVEEEAFGRYTGNSNSGWMR